MTTGKKWQDRALRLLICIGAAALLTGVILHYSFRHGRLSTYLKLDDIGYINDGMYRLNELRHGGEQHQGGWEAVWKDYRSRPPHSPYSDFLAMAALGVLGIHDWAPYAANGLLALAFFLAADQLLRGMKLCQRLGCMAFFGAVPLMGMAIHEFLPDFAVALLTAGGIMLLLSRPFVASSSRHKLFAGMLFGFAMLVKPPVFPATLVFFCAALTLALLCDRFAYGRRITVGQIVGSGLLCLLPLVLIALPHYYVNGHAIYEYIHDAQFGIHAQVWAIRRSLGGHLSHYLIGDSGRIMLGKHLYVMAAVLALGVFVVLRKGSSTALRTSQTRDRVQGAALAIMLLLTWLQPTLNPHKQLYLGLTFQVFLLFLTLHVVKRLLIGEMALKNRAAGIALPIALAALGLAFFRWPEAAKYSKADRANRDEIVRGIYRAIVNRADSSGVKPFALLTGSGDINGSLYQYFALTESRPFDVYTPSDSNDPRVYAPLYDQVNFIVAADEGSDIYVNFLLNSRIQQTLLQNVRDYRHVRSARIWIDPGLHIRGEAEWEYFKEIGKFTNHAARDGERHRVDRSLYLFERTRGHMAVR